MLRTVEQYLKGLCDDRDVWYRGERVADVVDHAELGKAARHASLDFALAADPAHADLAVRRDETGEPFSAYYAVPRTPAELADRSRLIEAATAEGATLVLLIKEIGTDALMALRRVLAAAEETQALRRLEAFTDRCRTSDLALAVAQTDVKGDRSKGPTQQEDPDLHLHVVERRPDGIFVRGAKVHTSCAPYVDEIVVLPSRSMRPGDEDWSVAFAVPVSTPGLRLVASDFLHGETDPTTSPLASRHTMVESLTIFDDVFVPAERVFVDGQPAVAGAVALTFVEHHRFTAVSYKLPLLDALVGCAIAVTRANGTDRAGHVREKLTWLIGYAETVRALTELAAARATLHEGVAVPDVLTTNLAKWTFARDYHHAVETVQDLAGGLLVTGPSGADFASEQLRPLLEKYLRAAWPAGERMAVIHLISDLTARLFGGWQAVLAVHAEGSIEAEKMALYRAYDPAPAYGYARRLAGLPPDRPG